MTEAPLADLLAQPVEAARYSLNDAARGTGGPDIEAAIDRSGGKAAKTLRKQAAVLMRALRLVQQDDPTAGIRLALKVLDKSPDNALALHITGVGAERLGRLSVALKFYERSYRADPTSPDIYQSLAMVAWKLGMLEAAEKFLRLFCQMLPAEPNGPINLGGVLRDQGRFEDAIEVIRAGIYAKPDHADLWNAMGTVLIESGDPAQALTFYQEALRLDPAFGRAHNNIAFALELMGDLDASIEAFDQALENAANREDRIVMTHGRSLAYLAAGRLEEGWDTYDSRLDQDYPDATMFVMKEAFWDGADPRELAGKKLLLVGEQGLGDEVMFLNAARDLIQAIGPEGKLYIASEGRLVPLIQRSFPEAVVAAHASARTEGRDFRVVKAMRDEHGPFDLWAPMGNAFRAFRRKVSDFPAEPAFLTADSGELARWQKTLAGMGPGLKVGLLWKSLKMTAKRKKNFAAFDLWAPILKTPGVTFVNLQYGDVAAELEQAERDFGVKIHQPEGIDLKDELDRVAALGKALDFTIGPMNATINLTCAVGGEAWVTASHRGSWTAFGEDYYPGYPSARLFAGEGYGDWRGVMSQVATALTERVKAAKAA
ncbi:tetratricopeptide repeat protein [Hyphobacterium marinum]|uniref:Tetratricopeptide repeat protein n=1 Tax=Hyphobacterium marinum TaxID=3116574 RepID=A0ABU7LZP6_9PROT|nr:tetratricopeptide repeat protein [Hyphobacterium sp. Y6023]MEE2567021.1 tetratricopeptide repeat protein [Hyphobacterium sp. Y6023]